MKKKEARALVTGGAGFIGSHLCDALLAGGVGVTCLDDLSTGSEANLSSAAGNELFRLERRDATEPFDFDVDCIFHLASPASPVDYHSMQVHTMRVNSLGTMNCLELAQRRECRVVLASTSEVYGDPLVTPQREDYHGNVNPVGPRSCYDEGKRFAEALCKAYERERGVEVVIVRIFNTYGPRMRASDGRVIPNFISQALAGRPLTIYGDGSQTRSFCHVSDMIKGIRKAMTTPDAAGEVINLGNPNEMRIIDLAGRVRSRLASPSEMEFEPLPQDDPMQRNPDISKAMRLLGWAPEVDLEDGLDDTVAWFGRHP